MSEFEKKINPKFEQILNFANYDSFNILQQNEMVPNVNYYQNQTPLENPSSLITTPVMNINVNNNIVEDNNNENETFQAEIKSSTSDSSKNLNITNLIKIENIVSTADLGCRLNLREIALRAKNVDYNPKRFSAVIMRIKEPKATALIFSSGKIVTLGTKNEEQSRTACRKFAKIIKSQDYPVSLKDFKIQNIVGSANSEFKISLIKLHLCFIKYINCKKENSVFYEPELFPGLIYRMIEPKIVLLIFTSGKIVLTGAKARDDIYNGFINKIIHQKK